MTSSSKRCLVFVATILWSSGRVTLRLMRRRQESLIERHGGQETHRRWIYNAHLFFKQAIINNDDNNSSIEQNTRPFCALLPGEYWGIDTMKQEVGPKR